MKPQKLLFPKRLLAALLLPLALLLAACEQKLHFTVDENSHLDQVYNLEISKVVADATNGGMDCDDVADQIVETSLFTVSEEDSGDGLLRCTIDLTNPVPLSQAGSLNPAFERDGDTISAYMSPLLSFQRTLDKIEEEFGAFDTDFTVAFTFPGPVEKVATSIPEGDYDIAGNTVTFHTPEFFSTSTTIEASANPAGATTTETTPSAVASNDAEDSQSAEAEESATPSADSTTAAVSGESATHDEDSNAMWWWIGGIALLLIVAGAIAYFVKQSKRNEPAPAPHGYPPHQQGAYPQQAPASQPDGANQGGYAPQQTDAPTGNYPPQPGDLHQGTYPQQGGYPQPGDPNHGSYPPPGAAYQGDAPQQSSPPAGNYPPQPGDLHQGTYPQQGGYPQPGDPNHGSYPPPGAAYQGDAPQQTDAPTGYYPPEHSGSGQGLDQDVNAPLSQRGDDTTIVGEDPDTAPPGERNS